MRDQMNRVLWRCGACLCTLGASAAIIAPGTAFAAYEHDDNNNTTEVTVEAADGNLEFTVPLVISFAASPDGTLTAADQEELFIENQSIFGIHVTNMSVTADSSWSLVEDATSSDANNSISFSVGPNMSEHSAYDAMGPDGIDLSADENWDMGYAGSPKSRIKLNAEGKIANATKDLSVDGGVKAATITWTIEAGQHHETQGD